MGLHIEKVDDYRWRIPKQGRMRAEGLIYADENMIRKIVQEKAAEQVANVATLPGIVGKSLAMPDIHWGYGFPIGGVAAMDAEEGVISPGGVGFDISCGMRVIRSDLKQQDMKKNLRPLLEAIFVQVPSGVGSEGRIRLSREEMKQVFRKGARWAVEKGYGWPEDLEAVEDGGCLADADPDLPSGRAVERGAPQLGTLGSGNHFLEVQVVDEIFDEKVAEAFGLFQGQVTVMVHTGSRGCGYQICEDFLRVMNSAAQKYGYDLPDRQLCCAPFSSEEGQRYYRAMAAGVNYARANRQAITHFIREAFRQAFGEDPKKLGLRLVYDISHNIAKVEEHSLNGQRKKLVIHRKGATRCLPAGHSDIPPKYREVGQPVLIPGTMGTCSYVLVGTEQAMKETFGTVCHGAGRVMSRSAAMKQIHGRDLAAQLEQKGVLVKTGSWKGLAEEAPFAYKDVSNVVDVCEKAGLSRKVARLRPIAVVKG